MPKASTPSRSAAATRRHNPLGEEILSAGHLRTKSSKPGKRKSRSEEEGEDKDRFVDARTSRKILEIGQELADEDEAERKIVIGEKGEISNPAFDFESRFEDDEVHSDDGEKPDDDQWGDEEEVEEVVCLYVDVYTFSNWHRKLTRMTSTHFTSFYLEMRRIRYSTLASRMQMLERARTLLI